MERMLYLTFSSRTSSTTSLNTEPKHLCSKLSRTNIHTGLQISSWTVLILTCILLVRIHCVILVLLIILIKVLSVLILILTNILFSPDTLLALLLVVSVVITILHRNR